MDVLLLLDSYLNLSVMTLADGNVTRENRGVAQIVERSVGGERSTRYNG